MWKLSRRIYEPLSYQDASDIASTFGISTYEVYRMWRRCVSESEKKVAWLPDLRREVIMCLERDLGISIRHNPEEIDDDHYRDFHGVPPSEVIEKQGVYFPGGMVFIGTGKDVGYGISNPDSFKDGWYVHDFGAGVKIYRRPRSGEQSTKTWSSFPHQLTNLGWSLGFTYNEDGPDGQMVEVKGSRRKHLAATPNRKTLVVIDGVGVLYLMEGGAMRVDDWIRD